MSTAGYSGTPLAKKLGIKAGDHVLTVNAPDDYAQLLEPLPESVNIQIPKPAMLVTDPDEVDQNEFPIA